MPPVREDGSSPSEAEKTEAATAAVVDPDKGPDAKPAESSTADVEDAKKPESMLDAVKLALEPEKAETSSSSDGGEGSDPDADAGEGADKPKAEEADGEDADKGDAAEKDKLLPFHEHPRWKEVTAELKAAEPKAQAFDRIVSYATEQGLTGEDVNNALNFMALMKNDPIKALEAMKPWLSEAQKLAGDDLPEDLQAKVDQGHMDEESARELAKLRGAQSVTADADKRRTEQTEAEREAAHRKSMTDAVVNFETEWAKSDPNYEQMKKLVRDRFVTIWGEKQPTTPEAAVEVAKEARKQIASELGFKKQTRKAVDAPVTSDRPVEATQEPKTYLEAVQAGLSASKAA